ncbi:MAG: Hsp20/alpha crystallin family protein [Candidatus Paceibacterota bacterium]
MRKEKKSFFEKLTGAINMDDEEYDFDEDFVEEEYSRPERRSFPQERQVPPQGFTSDARPFSRDELSEGQLSVDVIQTPDDIIIKTIVAGVSPEDLDVSISRDSVTIKGNRIDDAMMSDNDYVYREVSWGTFSRTISLPAEVEVEEADASERHGILTIRLPKIDKERQTKLLVKRTQ